MQSRNPILNNSDTFNGRGAANYGTPAYPAGGQGYQGYGQPRDPGSGHATRRPGHYPTGQALEERMTIDSVVMRTRDDARPGHPDRCVDLGVPARGPGQHRHGSAARWSAQGWVWR